MQNGIRINKFLSEAGVCSRREADRRIAAGDVRIGDHLAVMGELVPPEEEVFYCGRKVQKEEEEILLAFHKPVGIVCTAEKREKNNVIDYIHYPKRIYPVGRLDKDSEGLLLLTNQGELVNKIMRAGNYHEKEYVVTVDRALTDAFLEHMAQGVYLKELEQRTRRCRVSRIDDVTFRIVLTQGLNRQIRRMCACLDYRVRKLVRVRIMNIRLGDLKPGAYRPVCGEEKQILLSQLRDSYSSPHNKLQGS